MSLCAGMLTSEAFESTAAVLDGLHRPRTGVLRRSCETCRSLKARCIQVPSSGSRCCKRCMDHGLECMFEEAIARPKRVRTAARTRVKDVEEKIDSLIALIAARKEAETGVIDKTAPNVSIPKFLDAPGTDNLTLPNIINYYGLSFSDLKLTNVSPMADMSLSVSINDVFSKGIITFEAAQVCLASFVADAAMMPFIVISPYMTLDYLRREKPCLLLAILVVCSQTPVQETLVGEFKRYIAQNIIVEARKGIDLVQGLIVYCNWHNRCANPNVQQLYQLTQLMITLAADFGLPPLATIREMNNSKISMSRSIRDLNSQYSDNLERMRTYVGCYHISHSVAIGISKPTPLLHSKRIEEAAKVIANLEQASTDTIIPHHIRLQRFAEEVQRTFDYNDPDLPDEMDGIKTRAMVNMLNGQLSQILEAMPPETRQSVDVQLESLFLRIYISEIGLQAPDGHGVIDGYCCDWCGSAHRTELIITCIRANQKYLDYYFSIPNPTVSRLNVLQVGRHMYSVTLLARVLMHDHMAGLDKALLAELTAAEMYSERSKQKLEALVTTLPCGKQKQDLFWLFFQVFKAAAGMLGSGTTAIGGLTPVQTFDACTAGLNLTNVVLNHPRKGYCESLAGQPSTVYSESSMSTTTDTAPEPSEPGPGEMPWIADQDMLWAADLDDFPPSSNNEWFDL